MRLEPQVNTHPRLLREATLGNEGAVQQKNGAAPSPMLKESAAIATEAAAAEKSNTAPKKSGSRFLGPVHLDERQKAEICRSLKQKGIGDEMGRQIFVAAVEYQLSACADQLVSGNVEPKAPPPPPARDKALDQILLAVEEQAHLLSELLLQIPKPSLPALMQVISAQDGRDCDEHHLAELGAEIDRLRRACNAMTSIAEVQAESPGPDPEVGLEFVQKLGGAFAECFEQAPTAAEDGAFRVCLDVLNQVTDCTIGRDPEFLARALGIEIPG